MAITIGTVGYLTLTLVMQDFRGQKMTKKIELSPTTLDATIEAIIQAYDNLSNAKIVSADVTATRVATGQKSSAISTGHEVNIDEVMELTFYAVNPINAAKKVARTIGVPAMISACELVDGSPIAVTGVGGDTSAIPTSGTALDMYNLISNLESRLNIQGADGARYTLDFVWSPANSHHIGIGDVVDTN